MKRPVRAPAGLDDSDGRFAGEVARGERFEFGKNWRRFIELLDNERIAAAEASLRDALAVETLEGKRFLDVGSGSGLFSLAAHRLGAEVHSFDYDPESAACTEELRDRYAGDGGGWGVQQGSVLDRVFLAGLGEFDVVYSWGVLHHTGAMWNALENVTALVAPRGLLFIAIYNDQGRASRYWTRVKRLYNKSPRALRWLVLDAVVAYFGIRWVLKHALRVFEPGARTAETAGPRRGMSRWRDIVDWVGGYPFEVAKPEEILHYYRRRGFELCHMTTCAGGHGCNEFVFVRK